MRKRRTTLGEICEFKYGKSLPAALREEGEVAVYGSNGKVGTHKEALLDGPAIIVGRKGSFGEVHFCEGPLWPIDTTYFIDRTSTNCDLSWLRYLLQCLPLKTLNKSAAIPGLNREDAYRLPVFVPPLEEQQRIAVILEKADALRRRRNSSLDLLADLDKSVFQKSLKGSIASKPISLQEFVDIQVGFAFKSAEYSEADDGIRLCEVDPGAGTRDRRS